ncbi:hypothetical protein [Natrinema sp. DC36]|uniref:hypothetical protein n=1 Tax=Natrinema sp. DC36 TaxID=2878680 RepID=UPI001CF02C7D|nr:hypothetical protein [Natrinema sp. DC36]
MTDRHWTINADKKFLDKYESLKQSSGGLFDNLKKTVERIKDNPLIGDPKTGQMKGTRTTHVEHLIVQWKLDPEILRKKHKSDLEEVYFLSITHHDKMRKGVRQSQSVEIELQCVITFFEYDIGEELNLLYNIDCVALNEPHWKNDGKVTIKGKVTPMDRDILMSQLPDKAEIEFSDSGLI